MVLVKCIRGALRVIRALLSPNSWLAALLFQQTAIKEAVQIIFMARTQLPKLPLYMKTRSWRTIEITQHCDRVECRTHIEYLL
jgi:hypothetical protein